MTLIPSRRRGINERHEWSRTRNSETPISLVQTAPLHPRKRERPNSEDRPSRRRSVQPAWANLIANSMVNRNCGASNERYSVPFCHLLYFNDFILQFEPNEGDMHAEKFASLALISKLERAGPTLSNKKPRRQGEHAKDDVLNVRKAIRSVTKGKGATALAGKSGGKKGRPVARKGRR